MSRNMKQEVAQGGAYADIEESDCDSQPAWSDSEQGPSMLLRRALSFAALATLVALGCVVGLAVVRSTAGGAGASDRGWTVAPAPVQFDAVSRHGGWAGSSPGAGGSSVASRSLLKPVEPMHDGNVCLGNEELFEGLCYHKCVLLTLGKEPIRSSPWSCCREHPCLKPTNEAASVGKKFFCSGYDVSGTGGCPHKPGACLTDEEMHLDQCYKKCELLTDGEFPHRVGAATCCKTGGFGCLDIRNDKTNFAFAVGGGAGDHDPSTPSQVHEPLKSLTEAGAATASRAEAPAASAPAAAALAPAEAGKGRPEPVFALKGSQECALEEELYGGLCYRKCDLLTYGAYTIRTSSWTCCKGHPCGLRNQKGGIGKHMACDGFDINGEGKCPRAPGAAACAEDEENFLGVCYRKCALLTKGKFPHRMASATCCESSNALGCLDIFHDKTSDAFDVGSGVANKTKPQLSQNKTKTQFSKVPSAFMMKK